MRSLNIERMKDVVNGKRCVILCCVVNCFVKNVLFWGVPPFT